MDFDIALKDFLAIIVGTVSALLGVLLAAVLTYRLARSGFSRDKVRERRVEAYSEILLALETAEIKANSAVESFEPDPH